MKVIKKKIVINVAVAKVSQHVTDPGKIEGWFRPNTFEARVGAEITIDCTTDDDNTFGRVKDVVPLQKLVYTFKSNLTKVETLVTSTLAQEGENTRLTLIHSGWDRLPSGEKSNIGMFDRGWGGFLANLQKPS